MRKDLSKAKNNSYYLLKSTHNELGTLRELYEVAAKWVGELSVKFLLQKGQKDNQS